jgi:gliding motility-associated-like protein
MSTLSYYRFLVLSTLLIAMSLPSSAQDRFERLYRVNDGRSFALQNMAVTTNGDYLVLSVTAISAATPEPPSINVTRFDSKGEFVWSRDYPQGPGKYGAGDILVAQDDTFYIAFASITGTPDSLTETIIKCTPSGDVVWSRAYANSNVDQSFPSLVRKDSTTSIYHAANISPELGFSTEIYVGSLDTDGNQQWGYRFNNENTNLGSLILHDIQITPDSGLIACGSIRAIDIANQPERVFLLKMGPDGSPQWSRDYAIDDPLVNLQLQGLCVAVSDTNGYVVGGSLRQPGSSARGLILRVGPSGEAISATALESDTSVVITSLIDEGAQLIAGGVYRGTRLRGFAAALSPDTIVSWTSLHKENPEGAPGAFDYPLMQNPAIGGYAQIESWTNDNQSLPYLVKMDAQGQTLCNEILTLTPQSLDSLLVSDTLQLNREELLAEQELSDTSLTYNGFDLLTLSLVSPEPFCEDSMILHTFDATVPVDSVFYEWSTGETTPTITVMEEGLFTVTVTIFDEFCYQLCDTGFIATIGPPQPSILVIDSLCLTGTTTLLGQAAATSWAWSNGENTPLIEVDQPGQYSVTATNKCGSGSAAVTVEETFPSVEILVSGNLCENGNALLVANALNTLDLEWNDGSPGQDLTITSPGTYSVLASNLCGTGQASIDIPVVLPEIAIFPRDSFCQQGVYILIAASDGLPVTWNTGETADTILVEQPGDYTVSTQNFCGESSETLSLSQADFSVKQKCVPEGFFCVNLPDVFSPNGDQTNDAFAPVVICPDVTNYNLKVFNRWGELVFETNDPDGEWDGTFSGNPQPMDVYAWLVSYDVEGMSLQRSGELTLVR